MNRVQQNKINPLVNEIFPDQDLRNKYKVRKIIGKGHYGYVAKAVNKKTSQFVAIKKIINVFSNESQTKRILREIILLKNCHHLNVVSLIEVMVPHNQTVDNFDKIYIVTEYCDTDLRKLFQMQETFLQIDDVKFILYQIACGIKYLHSGSVIHRDLTPSNILINGQGMGIKICDLGLARVVETKSTQNNLQDSSDDQTLENQIKNSSLLQGQNLKNQLFNPFQHIDSESIPSSPNTEMLLNDQYFSNADQFFIQRGSLVQLKSTTNQQSNFDQNFDDLRGSHKSAKQIVQPEKKKKKLGRMNSKRSQGSFVIEKVDKKNTQILQPFNKQSQKVEKIQSKKRLTNNPISKLTLKVTTRWYRAPQVILLEKQYHKPIDIWSLGCLFGQLLKMIKSVCYNSMQRFPLFPGKYCYPVSPATLCNINRENAKQESSPNQKQDQLFMILSTIGKPSQQDLDFLTDQGAKQYIESMQDFQRKQFRKFFPTAPQQAIDILQKTLVFNPNKRMTIDEVLEHPFLQPVRKQQLEKQAQPIIMQFEQDQEFTIDSLRKYLSAEIKTFFS